LFSPTVGARAGRLFLGVPRGSDLLLFTYSGSRSNAWADDTIPDLGTQSRVRSLSVACAAIMEIDGHTAGPGISIPYSALKSIDNVSGEVTEQTQGLGDTAFTFDYNLFGAPSLSPEEFRLFTPVPDSGLHFTLCAPSGRYDPDASTNVGSNRWSLKALLNYSYTWDQGHSWIDFYPGAKRGRASARSGAGADRSLGAVNSKSYLVEVVQRFGGAAIRAAVYSFGLGTQ
jgi:hypothetical protein